MKMSFEIAARTRPAKWAICCSCRRGATTAATSATAATLATPTTSPSGDCSRSKITMAVWASDKGLGAQCPKRSLIIDTPLLPLPPQPAIVAAAVAIAATLQRFASR